MTRSWIALASCDPFPAVADDEAPLREALRRRGFEVFDPPWDDRAFDWSRCAAVLLRCTWDYQRRAPEFLAWCERVATVTRLFHPPEVVRWNIDKRYLRALDVPIAPTVWLEPGAGLATTIEAATRGWARAFLKPVVGANAEGTLRFVPDAHGIAAAAALASRAPAMLQPYLASVEERGELSIVTIDGRPSHALRKIPVAGDYRVQEDYGASDVPAEADPEAAAIATRAIARASELLGTRLLYGRVDLLWGPDGGWVLNELELIEPAMFFRQRPAAGDELAAALIARL